MALGDVHPTTVVTADGARFRLGVACCDPVSDIAVLEELDNQEFGEDCDAFEQWRERVKAVPLSKLRLSLQQSVPG
jgi:hypothetical protein